MITRRSVVLILGAGASSEFGFPSGWKLVQEVCRGLRKDDSTRNALENWLGFNNSTLDIFRDALMASRQSSVDQFLELRPEFLDVGKSAIAAALIPFEVSAAFDKESPTWYDYLLHALACKREDFCNNRIGIVTYNYDRSLEFFLLRSVQHSYGLDPRKARELVSSIPIIHLHGSLGDLALSEDEPGRPYVGTLTVDGIKAAAAAIRVVHEEIVEPYERALELLGSAEVVCFLGFGYNATNVNRLSLHSWPNAQLYGTTVGFTDAEQTLLHADLLKGRGITFGDKRVLEFLRFHALLP